jgi:eukaryotic-like serine/threonine-protein kinase
MAQAITANADALLRPASDPANALQRRRGIPDDGLARSSRVSSWKVEGELGRGGMSSVHAVVHTKFGKRAAIKIAHRSVLGSGGMSAKTFWREARIVHAVDHPAVIDVFATGSYDSRPYLVMEKLVGTPLGRRVDQGPIPRREAIEILLELCDVLRAAHNAGVIHRDLKLDNVFVCATPFADGRRIKLLDWGVAYVEGEDDPFRGLIAGTLTYVAPEQIRGDALTGAADIYSLAVLAYHLLCRRPPFAGPDLSLLQMHLRAEPPPPSMAWPDVPPELDRLLVRMLAKQADKRPSLDEIEDTLRTMLGVVEQPMRFAEGSQANIVLPPDERWYLRWLMSRKGDVSGDVLGRPILPAPPFKATWMALAVSLAALAGLLNALP